MTGCFAVCLAIVGCVRPPPNSLALDQDKAGTEGEESEQTMLLSSTASQAAVN